jgi:hypothetical protein
VQQAGQDGYSSEQIYQKFRGYRWFDEAAQGDDQAS